MTKDRDWDFGEGKGRQGIAFILFFTLYGLAMALLGGAAAFVLISLNFGPASVPAATAGTALSASDLAAEAVARVKDAVVGVVNLQSKADEGEYDEEGYELTGSGIVYARREKMAYVVTAYHVIAGADAVEIVTPDGERVAAQIVGYDVLYDLAVLAMPADKANTCAPLGDSDQVRLGETVFALGNPLGFALSGTVTQGVVSGIGRLLPAYFDGDDFPDWEFEVIQTDAAINFGNSGGALINLKGEVIGINSAKIVEEGVESIGFSIPINVAKPILDELLEHGKVARPYLGIVPVDLAAVSEDVRKQLHLPKHVSRGVVIGKEPVGPGKAAGLRRHDVIVALDGVPIASQLELRKYLYAKEIGQTVEVTFYREGMKLTKTVVLGEMPRNG